MMHGKPLKRIEWIGGSRRSLRAFPDEARYKAGSELLRVQEGKTPTDWKAMPDIGAGAIEIRIHLPYEHRIIYVAKFQEAIYVLSCFEKKTQKTTQKDIYNARTAYAEIQEIRKG
jgi:phage-related protein